MIKFSLLLVETCRADPVDSHESLLSEGPHKSLNLALRRDERFGTLLNTMFFGLGVKKALILIVCTVAVVLAVIAYVYSPRFLPREIPIRFVDFTEQDEKAIYDAVDNLPLLDGLCLNFFVVTYSIREMNWCDNSGLGNNIGGGCDHIRYNTERTPVLFDGLDACGHPLTLQGIYKATDYDGAFGKRKWYKQTQSGYYEGNKETGSYLEILELGSGRYFFYANHGNEFSAGDEAAGELNVVQGEARFIHMDVLGFCELLITIHNDSIAIKEIEFPARSCSSNEGAHPIGFSGLYKRVSDAPKHLKLINGRPAKVQQNNEIDFLDGHFDFITEEDFLAVRRFNADRDLEQSPNNISVKKSADSRTVSLKYKGLQPVQVERVYTNEGFVRAEKVTLSKVHPLDPSGTYESKPYP